MPRQANRLSQTQNLQLNTGLAAALQVLRFDASGLTRYLEEQAAINPYVVVTAAPPDAVAWLPRWTAAFAAQGMGGPDSPDVGALLQAPALGLVAHVSRQIDLMLRDPRDREIAYGLLQALEPSGWLGRPLPRIAAEMGCDMARAQAVLAQLQGMEPTGLFARSLAECLELQAREIGAHDVVMAAILAHLDLLAAGDHARLARLCGVDVAEVVARLRVIRSFDPKPGTQFGQVSAPVREPDLMVVRGVAGWEVSLNRSALPDVALGAGPDGGQRKAAREVMRMVASRNQTLLRVGQAILTRQEAVLAQGMEALVPMRLGDIAEAVGLHPSTVSRAVAGVSVDTPRATIWLRALFTADVGGTAGGAIRARLARMVRDEDTCKPLTDLALAAALSTDGPAVARRTVAKYREMMDIAPAHRRRRV
jgi:RNA polymerase sigma-54 factor